jgi:hypothetical protein
MEGTSTEEYRVNLFCITLYLLVWRMYGWRMYCEAGGTHPDVHQTFHTVWLFTRPWRSNPAGSRQRLCHCNTIMVSCLISSRVNKTSCGRGSCLVQRKWRADDPIATKSLSKWSCRGRGRTLMMTPVMVMTCMQRLINGTWETSSGRQNACKTVGTCHSGLSTINRNLTQARAGSWFTPVLVFLGGFRTGVMGTLLWQWTYKWRWSTRSVSHRNKHQDCWSAKVHDWRDEELPEWSTEGRVSHCTRRGQCPRRWIVVASGDWWFVRTHVSGVGPLSGFWRHKSSSDNVRQLEWAAHRGLPSHGSETSTTGRGDWRRPSYVRRGSKKVSGCR